MRHIYYEELADIVGGKFQLTVLMQKRLRELQAGAKPCIAVDTDDLTDIVIAEIRAGAIQLEQSEDLMQTLKIKAARSKKKEED
ncbi:DNA-directed RNA polymerase subunit omega [Planctomycetota bacterium]